MRAQQGKKLPDAKQIAKFLKNLDDDYRFKSASVKVSYKYKNRYVSFNYNLTAKNNNERILILLTSPKVIAGTAILNVGTSFVWKNPNKKPFELSQDQLIQVAWKSLLFNRDLTLNFDYPDVKVKEIKFPDKAQTQIQAMLKAGNKKLTGFEKAFVYFDAKTKKLKAMSQFWNAKSRTPTRVFKFEYIKLENKTTLKSIKIKHPASGRTTLIEFSKIAFPNKIEAKKLDLPGAAGYLSAAEIVKRLDKLEEFDAMKAKGKQIIYTSSGTKRTLEYQSWAVNRSEKQLMKYIAPADVAGDKILMLNDGDDIFVYFHRTGRVRHLATHMRKQSVMSSDFSYQDIGGGRYQEKYTFRLLRKEKYDSHECYVLSAKPTSKGPSYDKVIFWVDVENFRTYKMDFYADDKPKPVKRLIIGIWKIIDKHQTPMKMTMTNLETRSHTVMEMTNVEYLKSLPASLFSEKELKR